MTERTEDREKSCGAIVFTHIHGVIYYVIVEQRSGRHCFPKGHVEPGETEHQTALREIWEETGLRPAFVDGFRERETYEVRKRPGIMKDVIYFLAEYSDQAIDPVTSDEIRDVGLYNFEKAMSLLENESRKAILEKADTFLKGRLPQAQK